MILLFSGTGNSLMVARQLRDALGDIAGATVNVERTLLIDPSSRLLEVPKGEPVIWVMPVYSWGLPPVMERFIRRCKIKQHEAASHFLVLTCGDDIGYADNRWRKLIGRRGWNPRGCFSVQMPNTYVLMKGFDVDSQELAAEKLAAMPERIGAIASAICRGFSESDVVRGSMPWIKTAIVYPFFRRFCMSPRPFRADSRCTGCGLCARSCPMENIAMAEAGNAANARVTPRWGDSCALCLRCYHICPAHAVCYGKETDGKGSKKVFA